jgi:hypothetical protein
MFAWAKEIVVSRRAGAFLQIFLEPIQGIGPRFLSGLGVEPLARIVEEGVVSALEHLHIIRLAGVGEGFF